MAPRETASHENIPAEWDFSPLHNEYVSGMNTRMNLGDIRCVSFGHGERTKMMKYMPYIDEASAREVLQVEGK